MAEQGIRTGVYAVIVRDEKLLLVEFDGPKGQFFCVPGGGIEIGESLHDALHREIKEETCAEIIIGHLLFVWEYIPTESNPKYNCGHELGIFSRCELKGNNKPRYPSNPDPKQVNVRWVPLNELESIPLIPEIASKLKATLESKEDPFCLETD